MSFKTLSRTLTALTILFVCVVFTSAQTPPTATGKVEMKQADGKTAPVAGATVTFHRTDQKGTYNVKTDKGGRYVRVGFPFGATYTIIVSAPGARPTYITNQNSSRLEDINFVLEPGDGSTLTLDQVRAANPTATGTGTGGTGGTRTPAAQPTPEPKEVAEARAADAAAASARANAETNDAKVDQLFASGIKALTAGMAARKAKNADEAVTLTTQAIEFYDQGIQINARAAELHLNKSIALRERGVARFNAAKDTASRTTARQDFKAAIDASELAVGAAREYIAKLAAQPSTTGGAPATTLLNYLSARFENYRIALQVSVPDVAEKAPSAIQEYIDAETDPAKKLAAQSAYGDALLQAGKIEESISAYRQALAANPNNFDAMYGLAIVLTNDPKFLAESKTLLQQYLSKAPQDHSRRNDAKEALTSVEATIKQNESSRGNSGGGRRRP